MTSNLMYLQSQLFCAYAELEGMKAENQQRLVEGKSLAYSEKDFVELQIKYGLCHNMILTALQKEY